MAVENFGGFADQKDFDRRKITGLANMHANHLGYNFWWERSLVDYL